MTTPATTLSPLIREQIVLALTQTDVVQCTRIFGQSDGSRCALGVIAERVFGFTLEARHNSYFPDLIFVLSREDQDRFEQLLPHKLRDRIVWANDILHHSFDQIAKLVKEWSDQCPGDPLLTEAQEYLKVTLGKWELIKSAEGLWKTSKTVILYDQA